MEEIWKPIVELSGRYEISNLGRCRNVKSGNALRRHDNGKGYKQYILWDTKTNKYIHRYVHRLVAANFLENPNGYIEVNHIDEDKSNNRADNLEWCTRQYNNTYGRLTENKMKMVRQLSQGGAVIAIFNSITEASTKTRSPAAHIGSVCRGERNVCGGYRWEYA